MLSDDMLAAIASHTSGNLNPKVGDTCIRDSAKGPLLLLIVALDACEPEGVYCRIIDDGRDHGAVGDLVWFPIGMLLFLNPFLEEVRACLD